MQSERTRIANRFRAEGVESKDIIEADANLEQRSILAEAEEKAARTRGEGEAEAIRILGDAIAENPEFFSFVRTLDAYKALKDSDTTLVLPLETGFYKYIVSDNVSSQP